MIYKMLPVLLIFSCWLEFSVAQDTMQIKSFSLKEAQEYAIEHNLNIQNAKLDVEHAEKVIWENTAMGLPQLNSSLNYNNNLNLTTTLLPAEIFGGTPGEKVEVQFGTQHNATAVLSASQMIFNGPYIVGLQASRIFKKASEQTLQKTRTDTKELVAQNYYLALLAAETYHIIDSNYINLKQTLYETQMMYEKGFVEETDVDQIRVSLITLENSLKSANSQIKISKKLLKYQLGLDMVTEIKLTDHLEDIIQHVSLDATLAEPFQVTKQIEYQLLETQEKLAYLNLKRQKYNYLPSLNLVYNNQWMAMRDKFNFFDSDERWYYSSLLGFSLNFPIFSSGVRRSQVSELQLDYQKAKNSKKLLANGLELQDRQARSDFLTAWEKYQSEKENVIISRKVLDRTREKVKEGVSSSLDLTQINNQYLQTESNLISAMIELLNAKLKMDKAMNRL